MKIINRFALTAAFGLLLAGLAQAQTNAITSNSAGPVKLGMTVAQVRVAVKPWTLSRTSDGEGVALIAVKQGDVEIMTLYADEADSAAAINENAKVELIQVWAANFNTEKGVHTEMSLGDAEKQYGRVKEIMKSEIESREFVTFADQPKGLNFRVENENGTAGCYAANENTTARYTNGTLIRVIEVRTQ